VTSPQPDELGAAIGRFRELRRRFEQAIPPTAISIDGRSFTYRTAVGSTVPPPGGFVALIEEGARRLGQVITQELVTRDGPELGASLDGESLSGQGTLDLQATVQVRVVEGNGVILSGDGAPFVDASVEDATGDEVAELSRPRGDMTELVIGTVPAGAGDAVPARIDAAGFDRHTFLCGQSGSGKTYSLGVVLERLLLDTELRIIVIDPNSDFVRLREARPGADPAAAARLADLAPSIVVRRPAAPGDDRLRLRFIELDGAASAGVLRLDPIRDSEEYDELLRALAEGPAAAAYQALASDGAGDGSAGEGVERLLRRIRNLGVDRFGVWAREQAGSVLADLDRDDWRCLVIDIGTLGTSTEKMLIAQAVLSHLWERRLDRRPVLVVIDEAHNVCPQLPESPLQFLATDLAIRIAAEGRKFGLYLLISTQRPQKVHENVVSQCDNLMLMRMNSAADVGHLTELFSFVPPSLLERATGFRQGEALVAGKIAATPTFVRFGARLTEEGGSDVPADWANPST
jgi:DNA helicase HerA-like ATPase